MQENNTQEPEEMFEINLTDILKFIKDGLKTITIAAFSFAILGVIVALSTPNEFTSNGKLLPELQSKGIGGSLGGLKSLAGLAGIDLGSMNSSEAIRPDLYPNIIQSLPFKMYILNQPFLDTESGKNVVLKEYLKQKSESGWSISKLFAKKEEVATPTNLPNLPKEVVSLTLAQEAQIKDIGERISVNMDKKSGVIAVDVKMPEAILAAAVTAKTIDYLTNYVTAYRTGKAKADLAFYENRVVEMRKRKDNLEYAYFHFSDANRNPFFKTVEIPQKKLQSEYELVKNLYDELNKQMEQAKIKLREETPVFQVLEPPVVPLKKSEPKRSLMVIAYAFFGIIVGLLILLWRKFEPLKYLKEI